MKRETIHIYRYTEERVDKQEDSSLVAAAVGLRGITGTSGDG